MPLCPSCKKWSPFIFSNRERIECDKCGAIYRENKKFNYSLRVLLFSMCFFIPFILTYLLSDKILIGIITTIIVILGHDIGIKYEILEKKEKANNPVPPFNN